MKVTRYFEAIRQRPDRAIIRDEWIERAIRAPIRETAQTDGRIRRSGAGNGEPVSSRDYLA